MLDDYEHAMEDRNPGHTECPSCHHWVKPRKDGAYPKHLRQFPEGYRRCPRICWDLYLCPSSGQSIPKPA